MITNALIFRCQACGHEWLTHYDLPMDMGAFVSRLQGETICPRCGYKPHRNAKKSIVMLGGPELKEECEYPQPHEHLPNSIIRYRSIGDVPGCPGWQAKPLSFETLWAALLDAGYRVHADAESKESTEGYVHKPFEQRWDAEATGSLEALLHATAKAIGVEI